MAKANWTSVVQHDLALEISKNTVPAALDQLVGQDAPQSLGQSQADQSLFTEVFEDNDKKDKEEKKDKTDKKDKKEKKEKKDKTKDDNEKKQKKEKKANSAKGDGRLSGCNKTAKES